MEHGLISKLGLRPEIFPPILKPGAVVGGLTAAAAKALGLKEGIPVCVGCGDNQAGFAGSVADPPDSILVNIGTGAQVSAWVAGCPIAEALDTRPHLDGGFLLVGAPLCGGASYAFLRDFFLQAGKDFFGAKGDEDIYEKMTAWRRRSRRARTGCAASRSSPARGSTRSAAPRGTA